MGVCLAHIRRAVKQRPGADAKRKKPPLGTAHAVPGTEKTRKRVNTMSIAIVKKEEMAPQYDANGFSRMEMLP